MPRRVIYHVLPSVLGWLVKLGKGGKASSRHVRKTQALRAASDLARSNPLAQVVVHKADGRIESDRLYGEVHHRAKLKKKRVAKQVRAGIKRAKRKQRLTRLKRRKAALKAVRRQQRQRRQRSATARKAALRRRR
jgi:hypothetical protein